MFKAMTLNINYYGEKHGPWPERRALIARAIEARQPDIIALQAVARDPERFDGLDQATQLARMLEGYGEVVFQPAMRDETGRTKGSAYISRHRVVASGHLALSRRVGLEDGDQRIILGAGLNLSDGPMQLFNAHFSWVYPQAEDNFKETIPFIGTWPGPALLMGDFNTSPDKSLIQSFAREGWYDAWRALFPEEAGYTFESQAPSTRIDYIFANGELRRRVTGMEVISDEKNGSRLSDHLGLMLSLS